MTTSFLDSDAVADARRFNRTLARLPRFKIRNRFTPRLIQCLLRLSQLGTNRALRRAGIAVESGVAEVDGLRVPLRILRPRGTVRGVVLDIHGGGWVIGNARMNDGLNAALIGACGVAVVSVDYRLAIDTPLAGIMDDCLTAARWLLGGGLAQFSDLPVFMLGESAGAHLAAATLLRLKAWPDLLRRVRGAVLYYGVYDLAGTASVRAAGPETLVLDGPGMVEALRMLTPGLDDVQRRQAPLSPLYGDLSGMPPALMYGAELDALRDDSIEMAARWREVAELEMHLLPEAPHGLLHFPTRMAQQVSAHTHTWIGARIAHAAREDAAGTIRRRPPA